MLVSGCWFWIFKAHERNAFEQVFVFWKREIDKTTGLVWRQCFFCFCPAVRLNILILCILWLTDILQYRILLPLPLLTHFQPMFHWCRSETLVKNGLILDNYTQHEHTFLLLFAILCFVLCSQDYFIQVFTWQWLHRMIFNRNVLNILCENWRCLNNVSLYKNVQMSNDKL